MDSVSTHLMSVYTLFVVMILTAGIYCVLATRNIMRALLGTQLLMKAVTLFIIVAGKASGNMALGQGIVITMIVIEVVVVMVMAGVGISIFRINDSLDARNLRSLRG